ncbi:2-keto-4-pentenoate hydratase/2-oxohepta-3-ene-1,7-dioic acid hydratase in catechol pathway [Bacillus niacini]|uniref:2-keto-4-pentenoate hydratase/2-oxohepta-3-ene-1,7-dioic acid hydratase in catechol pathway n=1 Tax=Neobacillus niacini TaxID=86668 RepID=A0A852T7N1_9BACI|nr:fumarylacetoacetate hydrolase family protein [Neobacillus niacini]NYE03484.1 2-keto-4-pentenoate hydratase/2-oxohepta-3-ene-1,7-dioic acid hydratase in catechol pathway [Neobacillus niacini]
MKFLTLDNEGRKTLGVKIEAGIIDVEAALISGNDEKIPTTITEVIEHGKEAVEKVRDFINQLDTTDNPPYLVDEDHCTYGPCVVQPNKIICVGLNYRRHADETNAPYPQVPILFNKFNNTLTGHERDIAVPSVTEKLDYEVELGVVIGKKAKYVSKAEALNHVFGYCTVNDLSARDLQLKTPQWLLGKTCDDFSPVGPYLVTADEVGDPQNLQLKTLVNGEVRQNSNTGDMIFNVAEIVSYISQHMTLVPGDLILTGTPEGVVLGKPEAEQVYLQPGDVVTVEIEKLGSLTNTFVKETI